VPELYGRSWRLRIGDLLIDGRHPAQIRPLDISFQVEKSTKREPNTFSAIVTNLSPDHRDQLEGARNIPVILEAGYRDLFSVIFEGDLQDGRNKKAAKKRLDNVNWRTELEGADGGDSYRDSRVQQSFGADTPVPVVLEAAVQALGIGLGNLRELGTDVSLEGGGNTYPEGTILSGQAADEVDRIVESIGLTWSIQNGVFTLREAGQPLQNTAYRLTTASGLIGSPAKDNAGVISAVCLLNPELYPARRVVLDSKGVDAQTYVDRIRYVGDTASTDWQCELELKGY
jgi:hypothetical protein